MNGRSSSEKDLPKMAAVVGWPVAHSLSPLLHNLWLERYSIKGHFVAIACPPHKKLFEQMMRGLQVAGFVGCNVTLPHKKNAFEFADSKSPIAQYVGAANLLHFSYTGVSADNTDCFGFLASLEEELDGSPSNMVGRKALIIGAGGATPAIVKALEMAGFQNSTLANRSSDKALFLQEQYPTIIEKVCPLDTVSDAVREVDLIVNTTSLGMKGEPALEIDLSTAHKETVVSDIIYTPFKTPLIMAAEAHGLRAFGGLSMLIHQAVPSFEVFFGVCPEVTGEEIAFLRAKLKEVT